ncbi:hypothetical protein [Caudoviricetes sp.]|nr:hypothetical protein [Caudoviricetes sp.]
MHTKNPVTIASGKVDIRDFLVAKKTVRFFYIKTVSKQ